MTMNLHIKGRCENRSDVGLIDSHAAAMTIWWERRAEIWPALLRYSKLGFLRRWDIWADGEEVENGYKVRKVQYGRWIITSPSLLLSSLFCTLKSIIL